MARSRGRGRRELKSEINIVPLLDVLLVLLLIGYHHMCKSLLKKFERGENTHSHVWYRWFNETPVLLLLASVLLVVVKPF